jgi:hypothetical protein
MKKFLIFLIHFLPLTMPMLLQAQGTKVTVNLAPVDGLDLTPDNVFNYQVMCHMQRATNALVKGSIVYRKSGLKISYEFQHTLQPGLNSFSGKASPQFQYSSPALRELFEHHQKLPQGIYEYCVSVTPNYSSVEGENETFNECTYHKSEDLFLINLVDPEDNAKLYELNPMLSWTVNYPFAAELQYRIRVAPIKLGQNTITAITRNNPVYDEKNLSQMSVMYPVYGKPLEKFQPYAWTVDAYYKGLLLGGAEPWKFTIIEDSVLSALPTDQSYFDFAGQDGHTTVFALDTLKLKYKCYAVGDTLTFSLRDDQGKDLKFKTTTYALRPGENYIDLDLPGKAPVRHLKRYVMLVETTNRKTYQVPFTYINPLFSKG